MDQLEDDAGYHGWGEIERTKVRLVAKISKLRILKNDRSKRSEMR